MKTTDSLFGTGAGELDKESSGRLSRDPRDCRTLVTDLVPSEIACLASSPGRISRTAVCISREEIVDFFEYEASSTITEM